MKTTKKPPKPILEGKGEPHLHESVQSFMFRDGELVMVWQKGEDRDYAYIPRAEDVVVWDVVKNKSMFVERMCGIELEAGGRVMGSLDIEGKCVYLKGEEIVKIPLGNPRVLEINPETLQKIGEEYTRGH